MKVMVVDDEKFSLEKISEQLETFDFVSEIKTFDNPYHALDSLKNSECDVAILDIEMFGMNGIELAMKCKCIRPQMKIIFLTGYSEYAVKAFKVRANGYLLKPASNDELKEELLQLTDSQSKQTERKVQIQTFGNFEVFVNGSPVTFERNKAKELLAYLVSRKGSYVNGDELLAVLYEDKPITASTKSQLRNIIASLTKSLKLVDAEELILKRRNQIALNTSYCTCDYYQFLDGDVETINSFMGEFMSNYGWAEFITGYLVNKFSERKI